MKTKQVAILVDLDFFIRRYRQHLRSTFLGLDPLEKAALYARILQRHAQKHLYFKQGRHRLYRIYIYDCPPLTKKVHHPKTGESIDLSRSGVAKCRLALHDNIRRQPMTALRLGTLEERPYWILKDKKRFAKYMRGEIPFSQLDPSEFYLEVTQKQVDMKIGIDITWLSLKGLVDQIVLVSGDSDFVPVAKLARREGVTFTLDPMNQTIRPELSEHIDFLRTTLINESELHERD